MIEEYVNCQPSETPISSERSSELVKHTLLSHTYLEATLSSFFALRDKLVYHPSIFQPQYLVVFWPNDQRSMLPRFK